MSKPPKHTDTEKFCPVCKQWKPHGDFYHSTANMVQCSAYCKPCSVIKSREHATTPVAKRAEARQARKIRQAQARRDAEERRQKREARRQYKVENPDWKKWDHAKKEFGLTKEQWHKIFEGQQGTCAICRKTFTGKEPFIDHNHTTGKTRGLLCRRCNVALGMVHEEKLTVRAMLAYLNKHEETP